MVQLKVLNEISALWASEFYARLMMRQAQAHTRAASKTIKGVLANSDQYHGLVALR